MARRPNAPCRLWYSAKRRNDVDRHLELIGVTVRDDVGEDAPCRGFVHVLGILSLEQGDHRAEGLADDLRDQLQRVLGAGAETHQRHVRSLARSGTGHFFDVDLACDHLVPECCDELGDAFESLTLLVRDQHSEDAPLGLAGSVRGTVRLVSHRAGVVAPEAAIS